MSRDIKKPETTDQYHRIPVKDCEITSTITVSEKDGIKALYCGDSKEIATYLFDVDKWSMSEAKKWVSEHKKSNDCNKSKSINRKNHLNIKGKLNIPADILVKEDGRRIIAGYASVAEIDLEDDLITTDALKIGLKKLIEDERYANIMLSHSDIQIGHVLKEYNGLKTHVDDKGLFLIAEIRKGFKYADEVWNDILNGDINGFSIAGYVEEGGEERVCDGDKCWNEIKNIVLFETSVCQYPCSQKSGFIVLNKNFKSYKCECLECGYSVETEKHCKDLICPECGAEMRREERPGVGKFIDSNEIKSNDVHDNVSEKEGDEMPDKEEEKSDKVEENKSNEEVNESEEPNPLDELHKGFETLTEKTSGLERRVLSLEKVIQDINKSEEKEVEEKPEEKSEETSEEIDEDVEEKSEEECEDCKASKEKEESKEPEESEDVEKSEEENVEKSEEAEEEVDEIEEIKKSIKDKDEMIESMEKKISELKSQIEKLEEEEQPTKSKVSKSDKEENVEESNIVVKNGEVYFKEY